MNMATKQEIFKEKLADYLSGDKGEKGRVLDAVCRITGCHRKAAVRRFKTLQKRPRSWMGKKRGRKRYYGSDVTVALKELWEMSGRICAERLHPVISEYISVLSRDCMWQYGDIAAGLLQGMSLGTMKDRIETFDRIKLGGGRGTTKPSHLKEIIPIRRGPWENPPPGFGEVDTVAHCGYTLMGDFTYTVQYTDVATIWTCLSAQWGKGEEATVLSIERVKERLPFPLLGIDPDSGSEFINWLLHGWCEKRDIKMTRTRPYMKNDHARIEQKNYANVRHVVGYTRFDDVRHVTVLNELYDVLENYINFFVPSMVCIKKERIRSRTIRHYDTPQTAYQRALKHPDITDDVKKKLTEKYATLNPKLLKEKRDRIISKLLKIRSRLNERLR